MGNKSALQLEVEKEMGFEIDEDLFGYLEHYARRKLEVANKSAGLPSPIHAGDDRVVRCDCFEAIPEEGDSE